MPDPDPPPATSALLEQLRSSGEHVAQFFDFRHLPPELQRVSAPFAVAAGAVLASCPRNPERTVALRKLLEGKDAAVRAVIAEVPA